MGLSSDLELRKAPASWGNSEKEIPHGNTNNSSISMSWKFVRNAKYQAPSQTCYIRELGVGPSYLFSQALWCFWCQLTFEDSCCINSPALSPLRRGNQRRGNPRNVFYTSSQYPLQLRPGSPGGNWLANTPFMDSLLFPLISLEVFRWITSQKNYLHWCLSQGEPKQRYLLKA